MSHVEAVSAKAHEIVTSELIHTEGTVLRVEIIRVPDAKYV